MKKPKLKPLLTILFMFSGMLVGLIVFIAIPKGRKNTHQQFEVAMPEISTQRAKHSIIQLMQALKSKSRIYQLMEKDSLTSQDTLEIKTIDKQINQLLHD